MFRQPFHAHEHTVDVSIIYLPLMLFLIGCCLFTTFAGKRAQLVVAAVASIFIAFFFTLLFEASITNFFLPLLLASAALFFLLPKVSFVIHAAIAYTYSANRLICILTSLENPNSELFYLYTHSFTALFLISSLAAFVLMQIIWAKVFTVIAAALIGATSAMFFIDMLAVFPQFGAVGTFLLAIAGFFVQLYLVPDRVKVSPRKKSSKAVAYPSI